MRRVRLGVTAVLLGLMAVGCAGPKLAPLTPPTPSVAVSSTTDPPGDSAPHNAENNSWKQRHELTVDEQRAGDVLAARMRLTLAELRSAQEFAPDATLTALLALGLQPEQVMVKAMRTPLSMDAPPPGAVFAVQFGGSGCVVGDIRPDRLLIEVTGVAAEFGCLEPDTH